MKKIITKIGITTLLSAPILALAQTATLALPSQTNNLNDLAKLAIYYLSFAVYFIMALAIIMFTWNIYKYFIAGSDNAEGKKEAGLYVMWSIIGFFVILSFWGLVNILTGTLRLNSQQPNSMFGSYNSSYSTTGNSGSSAFGTTPGGNVGSSGTTPGGTVGSSGTTPGFFTRVWNAIF